MAASYRDVMPALLSFDAYSRGENSQLLMSDNDALSVNIGNATWISNSDDISGATEVGFSASRVTLEA